MVVSYREHTKNTSIFEKTNTDALQEHFALLTLSGKHTWLTVKKIDLLHLNLSTIFLRLADDILR